MSNTFGKLLTLTTFGESHGPAMGGILDGMPPMVRIDMELIRRQTDRRRPGAGQPGTSTRREADTVEILSGIGPDGLTLGTPIGFIIRNSDARPGDYEGMGGKFRPNHADYTYYSKYGVHDFRGGGRASARETVSWVVAGAIARQWLNTLGIEFTAQFERTGSPEEAARRGDSIGGIVRCSIKGLPAGVGEPVADKLHARLAAAMMQINAAKAFEYGDGFRSATMAGSESRDLFAFPHNPATPCLSNHSGGIQGGISNGMPVEFAVYFKPTPTIMQPADTIDTEGNSCTIKPRGRHDSCVAIRAVPVVEAMAALVVGDMLRLAGAQTPLLRFPNIQ